LWFYGVSAAWCALAEVLVKPSSIVCVLIGLSLVNCKIESDAGDGLPRIGVGDPSGTGGTGITGSGGAFSGSGGGTAGPGNASVGAAGMHATGGAGGMGVAGMGSAGMSGSGGMGSGGMGSAGMSGSGGMGSGGMGSVMNGSGGMGSGGASGGDGETGKLVGMTAAHNAVRAEVDTSPPLPPMKWSATIAAYAQDWTDMLAMTCDPQHRTTHQYGENLAAYFSNGPTVGSTAQDAVDGWAGEVACWTYGVFGVTDQCNMSCSSQMFSDGCGHYTQIVWRDSVELGCGFSTCTKDGLKTEIWICNYGPPGNVINFKPY
jgi:pathogenesis-related protein 1